MIARLAALTIALSACAPAANNAGPVAPDKEVTNRDVEVAARVTPPAPGTPEGLPDDRTPVSEAPFAANSAQGAANVVQTYFALVEAHRYGDASRLRSDGLGAAAFAPYAEYHAEVGAPGEVEGAAGSSYVEVPVTIYGRRRDGEAFRERGTMVLRRVNDVDGATAEQRRWHIERSDVEPHPPAQ
jgi:hypothetical protein